MFLAVRQNYCNTDGLAPAEMNCAYVDQGSVVCLCSCHVDRKPIIQNGHFVHALAHVTANTCHDAENIHELLVILDTSAGIIQDGFRTSTRGKTRFLPRTASPVHPYQFRWTEDRDDEMIALYLLGLPMESIANRFVH